ncbi:MAG: Gfo/Idh/MocA family protein [Saprospiraceae bacterium]
MAKFNRRAFIQSAALTTAALATPSILQAAAESESMQAPVLKDKLRLGFIGVGLRGQDHVMEALLRPDCEVVAIADPNAQMIGDCLKTIESKGKSKPKVYGNGNFDYLKLLEDKNIDAVVIASPWEWHTQQAVAAMKAGKYVALEVSGGFSLDECWQLVNVQEETGTHLMFLENVCYRRDVMAILQIVREGLMGEMIHLEGGYEHDLRGVKFNDGVTPYDSGVEFGEKGFSEAKWRTKHSVARNGELYPTHGIGPVAMYANINRGNRFTHLTSMSSKSRGLHDYIMEHPKGGPNHPNAKVQFNLGDVVTTQIKCANGETVLLTHDTSLPRPYSLGFRVQGSKGIWMDVNRSIHIEGKTKRHAWEPAQTWLDQYDHPLWMRYGKEAEGAGHGGMDYFVFQHFVESAKRNQAPEIDVYDAATWLAITPLSEASIATGSMPQSFPDFTRGRWTERKPNFAFNNEF